MHSPTRTTLRLDRAGLNISLLIACVGLISLMTIALPTPASAEVSPTPTPTTKPENPPAPVPETKPVSATKQVLGQWLTKEALDGDMVMLVFAPDGKAYIISGTAASGNAIASQVQYRIDDKPQPIHLDIILADKAIVETLFEFTPTGELRLQMLGTRPGKPRPAALNDNATLFQKVSDETTLPPGTELKQLSAPTK
ncbi:MAG: hypothetical protein ACAF41_26730 [Leptolyngbya sp. BL-A-14]